MKPQKHYRHGDVLFTRIEDLPENVIQMDTKIIAEGEKTGHNHKFGNEQTLVYKDNEGKKFVTLSTVDTLKHPEHKEMTMPIGNYAVSIEREYDAFNDMEQQVRD